MDFMSGYVTLIKDGQTGDVDSVTEEGGVKPHFSFILACHVPWSPTA